MKLCGQEFVQVDAMQRALLSVAIGIVGEGAAQEHAA